MYDHKEIIGKKIGMTSIFQNGKMIPVTVVQAGPCIVTQIKTKVKDGYNAIQVGFLTKKEKHTNKPLFGHFKKNNISPLKILKEIKLNNNHNNNEKININIKEEINVKLFSEGEYIDVLGISKGKGFSGTIKKYNFHRGPMSHGSRYHRGGGSLGSMAAAHVFKGHKMPGRMGSDKITIQNLIIASIIPEDNIILIKGSIPGSKNSIIIIKSAKKKQKQEIK